MPQDSWLPSDVKPGEKLSAKVFSRVLQIVKNYEQNANGFIGGGYNVTRRIPGGTGTSRRWAEVTSDISAGSWAGPGTGMIQPKVRDAAGTTMVDDGPPITVINWLPLSFLTTAYVEWDDSLDPPEIIEGTCVTAEP